MKRSDAKSIAFFCFYKIDFLFICQVGFLVQTYAHKLAALEFELFHQIVNSLVFGCQQVVHPSK